jgi:Ser/Thr protein kinase RdoA (MazF antagonist)
MPALETITRHFFAIDRWIDAAALGSGNINDTYQVTFESNGAPKTVVIQRLNHQVFRQPLQVMDNMVRVTAHLRQVNFAYAAPEPIPTLDGQWMHVDSLGNYWRCLPLVADSYAPEGKTDVATAREAARAYAAFARALQDFPADSLAETIPGFHDTDQRWVSFLQVIGADSAGRVAGSTAEIAAMWTAKPVFDQISALKKSGALPLRVTHNDTKAGNVLFHRQTHQAIAVIDLDTVMPGTILSDFGDMVRTFVPDRMEDDPMQVHLRSDMLEALLDGFLSETTEFLQPSEQQNLLLGGAWITGEQALRFLTDWLAGDVYYKTAFPEHNLVRARNQLQAFAQLVQMV